jgi:hypothetical protein
LRVYARAWVSDPDELVGPGSRGRGWVELDAALVAGGGPDRLEVVLRPPSGIGELESTDPLGSWPWDLLGLVHPTDGLPDEGLVHRVRQEVALTWMRHEGGSQNVSWGRPRHRVSTTQYSYACELGLESDGTTWTSGSSRTYTWNGAVW